MADDRTDPLADLFTLFVAPVSGTVRSIEQFRKGVDEFLRGVENFNRTMENLNETTERINALVADIEEPIRAVVPQITRTVKAADEMMQVVSGPAIAVAPGLYRLAETLTAPAFAQLPSQMALFSDVLGELSKRLGPFTQFAESAGGLFGGFRVPGSRPSPASSRTREPEIVETAPPSSPAPTTRATTGTSAPKQTAAKKKAATKKKAAATKTSAGSRRSAPRS